MNNKRLGNAFEKEYAEILASRGYWVTFLTPKQHIGSQPCDLVASKDNVSYFFECKTLHSKYNKFPLSRVEQNQILAWNKLKSTGNYNYFLVVLWNDTEIYKIPFQDIDFKEKYIELIEDYKLDIKTD